MLYIHGKKISDIFINGKSWERGYLNGNLIFHKTKKSNPVEEEDVLVNIWWQNDTGVITKEEITITDLNNLCYINPTIFTYTITLSNGHSFKNTDIVDFTFENSTNFPVTLPCNFGKRWTSLVIGSQSGSSVFRIPDKCTSIGDSFMFGSTFAPTEFYLNNVTSLGNAFLQETTFNCDIDLSNITYIGSGFLCNCMLFNKPITCYVENINAGFLHYDIDLSTNAFNSPITLINTKTIGDSFVSGGAKRNIFNSTLVLPNTLESIGDGFLTNCDYSGVIDLSNTNISYIGEFFNSGGKISNILLPTIKPLTIDNGFMYGHVGGINSTFVIPSNVTYIGHSCLICEEKTHYIFSEIKCNADPSTWANDGVNVSFSYYKHRHDNILNLSIIGTYASEFIAKYPNSDANLYKGWARYYC